MFWCLINTNHVCYGVSLFALPDCFEDDSWRNHERVLSKQERFSLQFGLKDAHKVRDLEELPIFQIFKDLDTHILSLY